MKIPSCKTIRRGLLGLTLLCSSGSVTSISADTAAFWRFEEREAGFSVEYIERDPSIGEDAVVDLSGNSNHLRTWTADTAPLYVGDTPFDPVPQSGDANALALDFDAGEDLYTNNKPLNTHQFDEWTIEVSFKADRVDLYQVVVGKDGNPADWGPSPVFLKILGPNQHLELGLVDGSGEFVTVLSDAPIIPGEWYSVAAVASAWEMSLWIKGPGDTDYVQQGFSMPIDGAFMNTAADFDREWSVGRGMWNGNITDWFRGVIDEVRISGVARAPSEFLGTAGSNAGSANTLAHWRFEEGVQNEPVPAPPTGGDFVIDWSGSGNEMRTFDGFTAPFYVDDVPFHPVPQTGQANTLALDFNPNQNIYTDDKPVNALEFDALTIEASFKANVTDNWQVIVGKDGQPLQPNGALHGAPPFMFKTMGGGDNIGRLEAGLIDSAREFHSVISLQLLVVGEWYSAAVTATATEFSFYLKGPGDTDYVLQGTRAINGAFTGPDDFPEPADFNRPWSVGRGMWAGGATDYFDGIVDEVRISTVALDPSQFLAAGDGTQPDDLDVRAVIVERMEGGNPRNYIGLETWSPEPRTFDLEGSATLSGWLPVSYISEPIGTANGRTRLRLTTNIAVDENQQYFLRLRVD